jgi:hypothetical protein
MSNFNCDDTFLAFQQALSRVNMSKNIHGSLFELVTESETTKEFETAEKTKCATKQLEEMCNKIKNCKKMKKAKSFVEDVLINLTNVTPDTFDKVTKLYKLCEDEATEDTEATATDEDLEPEIKEELDHYIKIYKVDGLSTHKILESMIEFLKWLCIYGKNADRELAKQFKEELEDKWIHKFSELVDADQEAPEAEETTDDAEETEEVPANDEEAAEETEEEATDDAEETEEDAEEETTDPDVKESFKQIYEDENDILQHQENYPDIDVVKEVFRRVRTDKWEQDSSVYGLFGDIVVPFDNLNDDGTIDAKLDRVTDELYDIAADAWWKLRDFFEKHQDLMGKLGLNESVKKLHENDILQHQENYPDIDVVKEVFRLSRTDADELDSNVYGLFGDIIVPLDNLNDDGTLDPELDKVTNELYDIAYTAWTKLRNFFERHQDLMSKLGL